MPRFLRDACLLLLLLLIQDGYGAGKRPQVTPFPCGAAAFSPPLHAASFLHLRNTAACRAGDGGRAQPGVHALGRQIPFIGLDTQGGINGGRQGRQSGGARCASMRSGDPEDSAGGGSPDGTPGKYRVKSPTTGRLINVGGQAYARLIELGYILSG